MIEFIQLFYFKYICKLFFRLYDQRFRWSCYYNVVDIKIEEDAFVFIYKAIDIYNKCFKVVFLQYGDDDIVLLFRRAL